ncbi:MAG: RluA family pseudouridine synthase [Pseudomonadota bacterium]
MEHAVNIKPPPLTDYAPPTMPLRIVHEDASLLLVDKPAGLLSVPGKAAEHWDCLVHRMAAANPGARLIHRLDMDTSGIMVFARSALAQRHVNWQFERRQVRKGYLARVGGVVVEDAGRIDLPLRCDWPNRPLQMVCAERGKPSVTDWAVLRRDADTTLMRLFPQTGRSHQLRVHLRALGHTILGDRFYGGAPAARLMLHAETLELRHPEGGAWHRFHAPCPFEETVPEGSVRPLEDEG